MSPSLYNVGKPIVLRWQLPKCRNASKSWGVKAGVQSARVAGALREPV